MTISQASSDAAGHSIEGFRQPEWLWQFLGVEGPWSGEHPIAGQPFEIRYGIPRRVGLLSRSQAQTEDTFGFKWKKRDTFDSEPAMARIREWLNERYGDIAQAGWLAEHGERPLLVDAGCGAGMSGLEHFRPVLDRIRYLGVDISEAVDVAADRFTEAGIDEAAFMQADISNLPFAPGSVDLIFSEGVMHHTDSTRGALLSLSRLLKPGGRFLFYVYRRKGPIREFSDDYIREALQGMSMQQAWDALEPLTKLGIALGELNAEIDIPDDIDLLGIPAGRINVQRLFYWHVIKMFYRPELTLDEMNHINFDWFMPKNAARQSPEEVAAWCAEGGLEIERQVVEDAGITIIARKAG